MISKVLCLTFVLALTQNGVRGQLRKHLVVGDACGQDIGTCSTNQGLFCDVEQQICVCPEGAEWILEHPDQSHLCRIAPGHKCARGETSSTAQCMGNYHCVPEGTTAVEGTEVRTVCKCSGEEHACETLDTRHGSGNVHSDGPMGDDTSHHKGAGGWVHGDVKVLYCGLLLGLHLALGLLN